jgi:hypothetical protein
MALGGDSRFFNKPASRSQGWLLAAVAPYIAYTLLLPETGCLRALKSNRGLAI